MRNDSGAGDRPVVETLYEDHALAVRREGAYEYVERVRAVGAVLVLAVTEIDHLVLVERYCPALRAQTIELPSAIVGDEVPVLTPEACALRALELETGYRGLHARVLASGPAAPRLVAEEVYLVHVNALENVRTGAHNPDRLGVRTVLLDRVFQWLECKRRAGFKIDPQIYGGLFFLSGFPL